MRRRTITANAREHHESDVLRVEENAPEKHVGLWRACGTL